MHAYTLCNGANASGFRLHHARVVCATAVDRWVKDSAAVKGGVNQGPV